MIASRERNSLRPSVLISTPSTCSEPSSCTSRHSAETKVDLPEPVRPTMPTLVGV